MVNNWFLLFKVPNGHKFFVHANGYFGVADNSGANPSQTDDGPLILDFSRPLRVGISSLSGKTLVDIPLTKSRGMPGSFYTSTPVEFLTEASARWPEWEIQLSTSIKNVIDILKQAKII